MHHSHESEYSAHHHPSVGLASALALSGHSLTDGIGIRLAFQVNHTVGFSVAMAIIAHDVADGMNTVSLMLAHGNDRRRALVLLALDAVTRVVGAAQTLLFTVPGRDLLVHLGVFAGFLLYIGASDILPEAHANHSSRLTVLMTVLGGSVDLVGPSQSGSTGSSNLVSQAWCFDGDSTQWGRPARPLYRHRRPSIRGARFDVRRACGSRVPTRVRA